MTADGSGRLVRANRRPSAVPVPQNAEPTRSAFAVVERGTSAPPARLEDMVLSQGLQTTRATAWRVSSS
jgi:hypothetical protein